MVCTPLLQGLPAQLPELYYLKLVIGGKDDGDGFSRRASADLSIFPASRWIT